MFILTYNIEMHLYLDFFTYQIVYKIFIFRDFLFFFLLLY